MFTARYALSPYIKQIRFVFKGLKQSLCIPRRRMGSGVIALHILNVGTGWRLVVSFTPWLLYCQERASGICLTGGWVDARALDILLLPGSGPWFLYLPAYSIVTVPATLSLVHDINPLHLRNPFCWLSLYDSYNEFMCCRSGRWRVFHRAQPGESLKSDATSWSRGTSSGGSDPPSKTFSCYFGTPSTHLGPWTASDSA
jgi:hypothetical protein